MPTLEFRIEQHKQQINDILNRRGSPNDIQDVMKDFVKKVKDDCHDRNFNYNGTELVRFLLWVTHRTNVNTISYINELSRHCLTGGKKMKKSYIHIKNIGKRKIRYYKKWKTIYYY